MQEPQAIPVPRLGWGLLATVWVLGLATRLIAAARCASLNPDGVVDLTQAQAWAVGDVDGALSPGFSPLLSLLSAAIHRLTSIPLEGTALASVVLGSSLAAPASALAAAHLCPKHARRAAFAAGLLAAVQPYLVRLGGQIMGYGLAHGLLAVGAALSVHALSRRSVRSSGAAGVALGLAFLARSDALTSGCGLAAALVWGSRKRPLLPAVFALGFLVTASPYLLALRAHHGAWRLSGRKTVAQLTLKTPTRVHTPAQETLAGLLAREAGAGAPRVGTPVGGWLDATGYALGKVASAAIVPLLLLALVGVVIGTTRSRGPPAHAWALLAFAAGQVLLRATYGYTGRTHASSAAILATPLAALAWASVPWKRVAGEWARTAAAGSLSLLLVLLIPKALAPQQDGRGPQRAVGEWIRAEFAEPAPVWGLNCRVVAHYAGATYRDTPELTPETLIAEAQAAGVRAFVVAIRHRASRPQQLDAALAAAGALRIDPGFASQRGSTHYRWLVFRLPSKGE